MKKKIVMALMAGAMVGVMMTGCGKKNTVETETVNVEDTENITDTEGTKDTSETTDATDAVDFSYKEGVIQLTDGVEEEDSENMILVDKTDATADLKEGDIIVVNNSAAYKVKTIKDMDDKWEIEYEIPEESEFVEYTNEEDINGATDDTSLDDEPNGFIDNTGIEMPDNIKTDIQ